MPTLGGDPQTVHGKIPRAEQEYFAGKVLYKVEGEERGWQEEKSTRYSLGRRDQLLGIG